MRNSLGPVLVLATMLVGCGESADLPDDATPEQRAGFEQGEGGALVPIVCVDKTPDEIGNFERLAQEAAQFGTPWRVLFASSMSGASDAPPTSKAAEPVLDGMVDAIKQGAFANMIAFDTTGKAISFE